MRTADMSARKEVFQSKVLQRLYPTSQESSVLETAVHERSTHAAVPPLPRPQSIPPKNTGNKSSAVQGKKLYTVLPPPEGYLITREDDSVTPPHPNLTDSEDSAADADDHELHKKRKRRRKRKKVLPVSTMEVSTPPAEGAVQGQADAAHPNEESTEQLSKNRKRKMKKKRHKEKLVALGLMSRARAVEFTYTQNGDGNSDEVLEFLRSTQEIYLSDRPFLSLSAAEALFSRLSGRTLPPAEISRLRGLRALLEKNESQSKSQLQEFKDSSTLPGDEVSVVCTLMEYWLTEILPMQREQTS